MLDKLIQEGRFKPVLTQVGGDKRWAVRMRWHDGKLLFHFLNAAIKAIPHPTIKDNGGVAILQDIDSFITDNRLSYRLNLKSMNETSYLLQSPELKEDKRLITCTRKGKEYSLDVDLSDIKLYAVLQ
jgi:hypothetical protein